MGIIRASKTFPAEHKTWEPLTIDQRTRWCLAMIEFPPIFLGVTMMVVTDGEARNRGWHDSGDWIELAKEFDAAGFTPEEFSQLNAAVRADERAVPNRGFDARPEYVSNALITLSTTGGDWKMVRLRAADWVDWLDRVRAGEGPQALANELLAPHWGEPAEVIHR